MHSELTQLVKVCVTAVGSWHGADQTGLEECRPLVHQTSLTAHVILIPNKIVELFNRVSHLFNKFISVKEEQCSN